MGGSATDRPETENTISKYKTIKVCPLYTVVISMSKCLLFLSPRERRSVSANAHKWERPESLLALLRKTKADIEAIRRHKHKQAQASASQQAPNSAAAPTYQQAKSSASTENNNIIEGDIGVVNLDRCNRCEPLIGEEVCGANGKTYVSLCHAVNCAGLRESDIITGRCVEEVN